MEIYKKNMMKFEILLTEQTTLEWKKCAQAQKSVISLIHHLLNIVSFYHKQKQQ